MSVNTAHAKRGVLIHSGEHILLHCKYIDIEFPGQLSKMFHGIKHGHIYLTSHRFIFRSSRKTEILQSLSAPFLATDDVSFHKESFSLLDSNAISGKVRAQPNGNFDGQIEFKLFFTSNEAAVKFGEALLWAISVTTESSVNRYLLPPYTPPSGWYEAPLVMHKCPSIFKTWLPTSNLFTSPSPNSVFVSNNHPPFPGIETTNESKLRSKIYAMENSKISNPTKNFDELI